MVNEAEQTLVEKPAETAQRATEVQEAMDKQFQTRWRQAEAQLQYMCESNNAQAQQLAKNLHKSELEHRQVCTANERRLQALRMSQDMEQQTLSSAPQREREV